MRVKIDGEIYNISDVYTGGYLPLIRTDEGLEFYVAEDAEEAGKAASKYWEEMCYNDPKEFTCLIGEERLLQWALGRGDSFGISSAEEFFERVGEYPEEEWASYDSTERSVERVGKLYDELGFLPTVAYRHN